MSKRVELRTCIECHQSSTSRRPSAHSHAHTASYKTLSTLAGSTEIKGFIGQVVNVSKCGKCEGLLNPRV